MLESEKFNLIIFFSSLPLLGIIVYRLYISFFSKEYHLPKILEKGKYRNPAQALFFIYSLFICFFPILLLIGKSVLLIIYGKGPVDAGGGIILALPILIFSFIFDIVVSIAFTVYVFEPVKNSYESSQAMPRSNILSKSSKHAIVTLLFVIIADFFMILPTIKQQMQYMSTLESGLYYPNAKKYSAEQQTFIQTNPNDKFEKNDYYYFLSEDPPNKIYKWYHNWLTQHGWQKYESRYGLNGYLKSYEKYKIGKNEFWVEINNPREWSMANTRAHNLIVPQKLINLIISQKLTLFKTRHYAKDTLE